MSDPEGTEPKQKPQLFKPGQSGNPAGRPKGSRNKLGEDFLRDLHLAWDAHGKDALKAAATEKPTEFVKVVAGLLPKEIKIKDELSEFTDEQLAALGALAGSLIGNAAGAEEEDRDGTAPPTLN